jgi:CheY-like chemotaxis protein
VRASGESLLTLINDILDFSKIEAGRLDLEALDFDLQSLLDDLMTALAVRAHEKGLELLCCVAPEVPTLLRGDLGRLRQILTNLAGNALKFTAKGEVVVRITLQEQEETKCLVRFSVSDTGIGIPAAKMAGLFSKFTQVDTSTTRKYGGTGLGLAIAKQLAELMGGKAGADSEEGKGSEFWFTALLCKQPAGTQTASPAPAVLRGVRVLIVDDNATSREILTTRMRSLEMRPSEAEDGPGGLRALYQALHENDPFRITVIDRHMLGMDGEAVGRVIKADARLVDTRMVMLSSLETREDAVHCDQIGFSACATKPTRRQDLIDALIQALSQQDVPQPSSLERQPVPAMPGAFSGCAARILIADDNITNQQVAIGILEKLGLRADAVANGMEAISALESIPYDLVLMDGQMPIMDGFEATRHIRNPHSGVRHHTIPIIALTALAVQGDRQRCLDAGMNDYVSKPLSPEALAAALARWLPKKNTESGRLDAAATSSVIPLPSLAPVVFDRAACYGAS